MVWKEIVYNGVKIKVDDDEKKAFLRDTDIKHGIKDAGEIVDIKEARRRIENEEYFNDCFYDKIVDVLNRISEDNGEEQTDVYIWECKKHGETLHLSISTECGYDGTACCLKCANELLKLYNLQQFPKGLQIIKEVKK